MITGPRLRDARTSVDLSQRALAKKAGVPLSVVERADNSSGEPVITITQLNALMKALWAAGASFPPADADADDGGDPA